MMRNEPSGSYDVIIAADVFIYLGKVDEIVQEIKRLLAPGGRFALSIEALETSPAQDATVRPLRTLPGQLSDLS